MLSSDPRFLEIREHLKLKKTEFEAILPFGGMGYATDEWDNVIGLKYIVTSDSNRHIIAQTLRIHSLKRIVIACHEFGKIEIPDDLGLMPELQFVWIFGKVKSITPQIIKLGLPIYIRQAPGGQEEFDSLESLYTRIEKKARLEKAKDPQSEDTRESLLRDRVKDLRWRARSAAVHGIYLHLNQLGDPPLEILSRGPRALSAFLTGRDGSDHPLNEVKLILVGDGGSGKTSLVRRLVGEACRATEPQTHGINIRQWTSTSRDGDLITVHSWDFGGQEIMHATHQFFLSKRSVYVLVIDGRKEEDPEYWLQHIESFGGDSPVVVVINKTDQNPSYDVNRKFLKNKYIGIVDFYRISCKTGEGFDTLKSALNTAIQNTPMLETAWPDSWFFVKDKLEDSAAAEAYISLSDYQLICNSAGINDQESQDTLVDFLHDLGVVVHFRDFALLDTHVLNPKWVTEGVYRIVNSRALADNRGILSLAEITKILSAVKSGFRYPPDKHGYIVDLMLKFEICYRLDFATILIPDLLDVQEPDLDFDLKDVLRFIYEYDYLPRSVIPRFIVRMSGQIYGNCRWRTGVALQSSAFDAKALVRADENAKRIYIFVSGSQRRDYFAVVRDALHLINCSFEKLGVRELVPLPDEPSVTIDYVDLLGHEAANVPGYFVGKLGRWYDVRPLLTGLVDEGSITTEVERLIINVSGDYVVGKNMDVTRHLEVDMARGPQAWERGVGYSAGGTILLLVAYLLIRNEPIADGNLVVALRCVLSLAVAALGAVIPGMLNVGLSGRGLAIRASGALALFVLTFWFTPTVL